MSSLALALAGCDIPEDPLAPQPRQLLVHAVLDAGTARQVINLEWSDETRIDPPFSAAITISAAPFGEVFSARPDVGPNNREVYFIDDMLPIPGREYTLRVELGTTVVMGTTTIPQATPVTCCAPSSPFSFSRDTLRLMWQRVRGAKTYNVSIQNVFSEAGAPVTFGSFYSTFVDTSIVVPGTLKTFEDDFAFQVSALATVMVSAVDDNFYTYYHAQVDPFAGAPASRLTGGLGVFGSLVPIVHRRLTVEP